MFRGRLHIFCDIFEIFFFYDRKCQGEKQKCKVSGWAVVVRNSDKMQIEGNIDTFAVQDAEKPNIYIYIYNI